MSLSRNFTWMLVGNGFYGVSKWALLVVLAKLGTARLVGDFALAVSIVEPVAILSQMQLRSILASDAGGRYRFGDYASLRALSSALALLTIAGIALLGHFSGAYRLLLLILGLAYGADLLGDIVYGLLQQRERMDWIAVSQICKGTASVAAVAASLRATGALVWVATALALVWLTVFVAYDLQKAFRVLTLEASSRCDPARARVANVAWSQFRGSWPAIAELARGALPLGMALWINACVVSVPRYFLAHYAGSRDLGLFAGMMALVGVGGIVVGALAQAAIPKLSRLYAAARLEDFTRMIARLLLFAGAVGVVGWSLGSHWGPTILRVAYKAEFADAASVLPWVLFAGALEYLSVCLGSSLTLMRVFQMQLVVALVVLLVSAFGSVTLIRTYGLAGAGYQAALVSLCRVGLHMLLFRSTLKQGSRW